MIILGEKDCVVSGVVTSEHLGARTHTPLLLTNKT